MMASYKIIMPAEKSKALAGITADAALQV